MTDHTTEEKINRAVLVGLNAACLSREENATESSMEELSALLETAGGACVGTCSRIRTPRTPELLSARARRRR